MSSVEPVPVRGKVGHRRVRRWVFRSRSWGFVATALFVALFASSLTRPLSLSWPPIPLRPNLAPLRVSVQQFSLSTSTSAGAVLHSSSAGSIDDLFNFGSMLDLSGSLTGVGGKAPQLVVRSDQSLFVIDARRWTNPKGTDPAHAGFGFLLRLSTRDFRLVQRPCVLLEVDGSLLPLANSVLTRCRGSG
jgi:hypothetical protein